MLRLEEETWKNRWQNFRCNVYFQIFFFLLVTFFEFVILELYFGISAFAYEWDILLKNVLIFGGVNLFLTGLFHSIRLPLLISVAFFTFVGVANYFVTSFRGYGIVFMDFYAVKTAAEAIIIMLSGILLRHFFAILHYLGRVFFFREGNTLIVMQNIC